MAGSKIGAIALNTFREAIRNKILYSVFFFAVFIVCIGALFGSVTLGDRAKVVKDFGLFAISFFGAIIATISGVSLLNKELKQKTIYNILSKPVRRYQFIVGKFFGISFTVSLLVSFMGFFVFLFAAALEGHFDLLLWQGIAMVILEVCIISAVAMFFSSLVVTTTLSGLFTFATYLAGRSLAYLNVFLVKDSENYNPFLAPIITVLDIIVPDLSLFNFANTLVYGQAIPPLAFLYALIYTLTYSTIALTLASLIFSKRELL